MARRIDLDAIINSIRLKKQNSVATPDSGYANIFIKTDGKAYCKNDLGVENPLGLYIAYICIIDKKIQNTPGGAFVSGAWRTRVLTDELYDTGNHASISSNQITLAAGTYRCEISCPAIAVHRHQTRLYNITNSAVLLTGTSEFSNSTNYNSTSSFIRGRFTIAAQKVLEIQHYCDRTQDINGFGVESNFGDEIYTVAEFWKEAGD